MRSRSGLNGSLVVGMMSAISVAGLPWRRWVWTTSSRSGPGDAEIELRFAFFEQRIRGADLRRRPSLDAQCRQILSPWPAETMSVRERMLFQTVMDSSPDLFWVKDRDPRIVRANAATAERFGVDSADRLDRKNGSRSVRSRSGRLASRSRARRDRNRRADDRHRRRNEPGRATRRFDVVHEISSAVVEGEIVGLVGVLRDVTALLEAERRSPKAKPASNK